MEGRSDEEEEGEETSPTNADASTSSLADDFRFRPASFKFLPGSCLESLGFFFRSLETRV